MRRELALDESPALSAPLRFFLNAPVFSTLAALLLLYAGPQAFATRWSPYTLAVTHLMTLGVFASVMFGALIQILPVATGVHVAWVRQSAKGVHALLTLGTLTLAAAFISSANALFPVAASMCGAAVLWFVAVCAIGLARQSFKGTSGAAGSTGGASDILCAIRLALAALLVTVALGAALAAALAWPHRLPIVALTDLHLSWGIAGWVGLLIAGVAYQVIPMFQVTEPYPRLVTHAFAPLSFLALVPVSIASFVLQEGWPITSAAVDVLLFGIYALFAVVTLGLLHRRKRPDPDTTTLFWRTSMISVVCCGPVWGMAWAMHMPSLSVAVGVMMLVGAIWSAINGMLYKIIPFLLWYHMQASLDVRSPVVPKMKAVLPESQARPQYWAHLCALLLMLAASGWPAVFARPAAIAFGVSSVWLGVNMARALRIYLRVTRELASIRAGRAQL